MTDRTESFQGYCIQVKTGPDARISVVENQLPDSLDRVPLTVDLSSGDIIRVRESLTQLSAALFVGADQQLFVDACLKLCRDLLN